MNLSLTPQLEKLVREKVAAGMYSSASQVVREALRLLERRDRLHELRLSEPCSEIGVGLGQLEYGGPGDRFDMRNALPDPDKRPGDSVENRHRTNRTGVLEP